MRGLGLLALLLCIVGCGRGQARWAFIDGLRGVPLGADRAGVIAALGPGTAADLGHGDGMIWRDGAITVSVAFHDGLVESVSVVAADVPAAARVAPRLPATVQETRHGIRLGMSRGEVQVRLGKAQMVEESDGRETWTWHASAEDGAPVQCFYDGRYEFIEDRLVAIHLHDGC